MINRVILVGNLGDDPKLNTVGESKVVKISIATSESYKNRSGEKVTETEWHRVEFWNRQAEVIEQYFKKGDAIYIEGKIKTRSYDDKDGIKRYTTEIKGSSFSFMPSGSPSTKIESDNTNEPSQSGDIPF